MQAILRACSRDPSIARFPDDAIDAINATVMGVGVRRDRASRRSSPMAPLNA
jgi:hypothetical protein